MKAIIIKDDRDIKILDIREKRYELYYARLEPLNPWVANLTSVDKDPFIKEVYELYIVRKNGDLVYRLKRQ